jgi:hypothetical protein
MNQETSNGEAGRLLPGAPCSAKPVICIGWPSIALLAHGQNVELENAILIPDDLLFNTAARIGRGELSPNSVLDAPTSEGSQRK